MPGKHRKQGPTHNTKGTDPRAFLQGPSMVPKIGARSGRGQGIEAERQCSCSVSATIGTVPEVGWGNGTGTGATFGRPHTESGQVSGCYPSGSAGAFEQGETWSEILKCSDRCLVGLETLAPGPPSLTHTALLLIGLIAWWTGVGVLSRGHWWWWSLPMQVVDDSSRAGQAQVAPIMVDAFHFPLAGFRDGQALVDICREGPAGHSQSPGLAVDGMGGRSPAPPSLCWVTRTGSSLSTQQAKALCLGPLPRACQS